MAVKIRQRRGKWWIFIDHHGKRKAKCIGANKRAATLVAEKIQAKLALGQFSLTEEDQRRPFDAYFQQWLHSYVATHCKHSTMTRYEGTYRQVLAPRFGHKDLRDITREDVKHLVYDLLAEGKSRNTVKAALVPLRELFNHAVEDGHLAVNPAVRILKRVRGEDITSQRQADFLTREELGLLLRTCQDDVPMYYPFVSLLARTGLRLGEAIGLQWADIDVHGRFLEVRRTLSGGNLASPKNGKTRRVDLSTQLTDTLKTLIVDRKKETLRKGWGQVPLWVFISEDGTPLNEGNFRYRIWRPLLTKAGLRHIRIHDLRHTFASLLIQNGESLAYVKEQLGHHSIKLTVDTYGHLIPGGNKAAVDRLDGLENETIRNPDATNPLNGVFRSSTSA